MLRMLKAGSSYLGDDMFWEIVKKLPMSARQFIIRAAIAGMARRNEIPEDGVLRFLVKLKQIEMKNKRR